MRNAGNMQQRRRLCYVLARDLFACERIILQDRSNRLNAGIHLLYKGDQLRALAGFPERIVREKDTHGEASALLPFGWAQWRCGGCRSNPNNSQRITDETITECPSCRTKLKWEEHKRYKLNPKAVANADRLLLNR
jgi:hypothetical protein